MVEPKIIYEDDWLLVLDKPSGWITNDAESTRGIATIQTWVRRNFQFPISNFQEYRNGIVHRLDKETSGILLIAKTKGEFEHLQAQFKERKVKKAYTALVHGIVEPKEGSIKAAVGRLPWRRDRFGVLPGGREAETGYKVLSVFSSRLSEGGQPVFGLPDFKTGKLKTDKPRSENGKQRTDYSLVELYPKSGRTHQIRIHLKHIGHPIVSDNFYAGRKTARNDRTWCPRLFLHADSIAFISYKTGQKAQFRSELPEDLNKAFRHLQNSRLSLRG